MAIKTYRFKLNPTKAQEVTFAQWLGACRYVYNLCLDYKKQLYSTYQISVNKNDIQKELSAIAKETDWIGQVHSQTLQEVTDRLFKSYDGFFKWTQRCSMSAGPGKGFPKFAKRDFYRSFSFKQGVKLHENTCSIALPKIGKVKYRKSQTISGTIKTTNVSKQADGWYISLTCETDIKPLPSSTKTVGLDVGIKYFLVSSDENPPVENPKYLTKYQYQLRKAQRAVSRKRKGSKNRKQAIQKLAKVHLKIRNTRRDFQHQLSTAIIRENQSIVVEGLKVSNLLKNHNLAKAISDCGWYQFVQMLEYKAGWYGRNFVKVQPHYTSQDCSVCGNRNNELTLADREWTCEGCNTTHCRDKNAAINIRNRGLDIALSAWERTCHVRIDLGRCPIGQ